MSFVNEAQSAPPQPVTVHGLRPLVLIYATALISVMGVSVILPVLPQLATAFAVSDAEIGILILSFTIPGVLLAPVGGVLADRVGRKFVLVPSLMFFALGGCMSAFAQSLEAFTLWRLVQGCGAACLGVLYNTIIGDLYAHPQTRLKITGYAAMTLSLGSAIYPALGGLLGEWGWRWPLLLSFFAIPLAIHALCTPLPRHASGQSMPMYARQTRHLLLHKNILCHFGITFCAFVILYGPMITYFPVLATEFFSASPLAIGLIFALSALGTTFAAYLIGKIAHQASTSKLARIGSVFFCCAMGLLLLARYSPALWLYAIPVLCYGLGQGLTYPAVITSLSGLAPDQGRGILMAANGTILRLAQSIAPAMCGLAFWGMSFEGVYFLGSLAAITMWLLTRNAFTGQGLHDVDFCADSA